MNIIVVASCFSAISTFFVSLRLLTRFFVVKNPGKDDFTIAASMCFAWCSFAFLTQEVYHGVGQPMASLSNQQVRQQLKALWLSIPFYNMSLTLTKAAIVFLYLRIFPTAKFILAARIILAIILVYGLWTVISAFLNCLPVNSFWDSSVPGHCIPKAFLWWFNAAMNILTDISILVLPIPVLSRLKLPPRQKIGVILIFATGAFACVTSIVRLRYLTLATHSTDPTKDNGPIAIWSQIEVNSGIICACLPPLQPLVTRFFPRLLASTSRSNRHYINQSSRQGSSRKARTGDHVAAKRSMEQNSDTNGMDSIIITQDLHIEFSDHEVVTVFETESERGLMLQDRPQKQSRLS